MNETSRKIEELKRLVGEELKNCSHNLWPHVCKMQSTEHGLQQLHDMIISLLASEEGMTIGSAIAHLESEMSHDQNF